MALFGVKLLNAMKQKKINHVELAKLSGVAKQSLYLYSSSQASPKLDNFINICEALKIDPNTMLGYRSDKRALEIQEKVEFIKKHVGVEL